MYNVTYNWQAQLDASLRIAIEKKRKQFVCLRFWRHITAFLNKQN